ncbi:MAG: NRDE family protein [Halobacteria archaeon]
MHGFGGSRVVAPVDEEAGGTWIGLNQYGLASTLSNLPADIEGERSRGLLCRDVLGFSSVPEARTHVESELMERDYAGFNLVVAGPDGGFVAVNDGDVDIHKLKPGIHVATNSRFDRPDEKARRVRDAAEEFPQDDPYFWLEEVRSLLASHDPQVCVHGDEKGTTSSSLMTASPSFGNSSYLFSKGKPCKSGKQVYTEIGFSQ